MADGEQTVEDVLADLKAMKKELKVSGQCRVKHVWCIAPIPPCTEPLCAFLIHDTYPYLKVSLSDTGAVAPHPVMTRPHS